MPLNYKHHRFRNRWEQMKVRSLVSTRAKTSENLHEFVWGMINALALAKPTNHIGLQQRYTVIKENNRVAIWHLNNLWEKDYVVSTVWEGESEQ